MTLLAPLALWLSVVGLGVVALYILKIKRRQQVVPALDFWLELAGRTRAHSLFERLKRWLSMLLWLAIVACLVLAVGNPILSLGRIKPRAIAIVIDNSASMQAVETDVREGDGSGEARTRLALAKRAVAELTTRRPVTDEWLLIDAAREPRVVQPWTFDNKSVRTAADAIAPFAGAGDLAAAVDLAGQLLAGKAEPCIVVVSDGAAGTLEPRLKADPRIVYWPVGTATDNLGITRLAVRAHRQNANHHAFISIVNSSDQPVDTQVTFEIDGRASSIELVHAEPRGVWEKTIVIDAPSGGGGGILRASIDRPDALALDNEAFAVLEPIRPAVVWLVSPPEQAFFFEQALGSMDPLVWAEESVTLSPDQYEAAAAAAAAPSPTDSIRRPDLVIFNNCTPGALPATGRFVFINAWPAELPAAASGPIETPQLFLSPTPHPLTQHVSLQGVRLAKAQRVALRDSAKVLAQTPEHDPLIVLFEQADRLSLALAFDVLESDMPFRNAFPVLLRNAVAFMHVDAPSLLRDEYRIGEPVRPVRPLPAGLAQAMLRVTRGGTAEEVAVPIADSRFLFTDTGHAGAIRLIVGEEACAAAVNIGAPSESRIEPVPAAEDPAKQLVLSGRLFGAMPWVGLAAAAAFLITLEWLTYHFRWTE